MKEILYSVVWVIAGFIVMPQYLQAQSVAINADSSKADASAILDLKSTRKGLLLPRMTMLQRNAINSPASGLLIYQTDNTNGYYYYDGLAWVPLKSTGEPGNGTGNHWSLNDGDDIHNTNIGNVGIGTVLPAAKLTLKTPLNTRGFMHIGVTDSLGIDSIIVTESIGGVSAGIGTQSNHPFRFISNNIGRMSILANGHITVGDNSAPDFGKLTVQTPEYMPGFVHAGTSGNFIATFISPAEAGLFTAKTDLSLSVNGLTGLIIKADTRNIGIGQEPDVKNKLQIGSVGAAGYNGNDFAIGNGTNAFAIAQNNNITQVASSTDIGFIPKNGAGNFGINTTNPINKFQVGYINPTGALNNYNSSDIAISNGNNAMSLWQNNNYLQVASTTDIVLMPRTNGGGPGRIGINTITPKAPLDVETFVNTASPEIFQRFAYYGLAIGTTTGDPADDAGGTTGNANVSIYASNNVMALQFDAFSDARIKNIMGVSNAAKDLQTVNALQVTDYTFKDKIKNGNKTYKKVIAQQVESVYPQIVSKHVDFIPNVYQLTSKIEQAEDGYLLSFAENHNISKTAKKLQVVMDDDDSGKKEFEIISVPSSSQVIISAPGLHAAKLFVYGEEVNDFRTVDYEGLTTLNISATQELSKQVNMLRRIVAEQDRQIQLLLQRGTVLKQAAFNGKQ